MKNENPLDALFSKQLKEQKLKPSAAVWERIAAQQPAAPAKRAIPWMRAAAVALLIGLGGNQAWLEFHQSSFAVYDATQTLPLEPYGQIAGQGEPTGTKSQKTPPSQSEAPAAPKASKIQNKEQRPVLPLHDLNLIEIEPEIELQPRRAAPSYTVAVHLSGGLRQNANAPEKLLRDSLRNPPLSERLMAYAGAQFDNLLEGEKPLWPRINKQPKLEIPLPSFN